MRHHTTCTPTSAFRGAAILLTLCAACSTEKDSDEAAGPQVLEARLHYDADASPQLTIVALARRPGSAPVPPPAPDATHVAEIVDDRGVRIYSAPIELPTFVEDPPPQEGDPSATGMLQTELDLAVTLPWSESAAELRIRDAMAVDLDTRSLDDVEIDFERAPASSFWGPRLTAMDATSLSVLTATGPTLDIAFVGDRYTATTMQKFRDDAARFANALLAYEPFHSRAAQIVFHAVENTADLGCVYQGRLILCNNAAITSRVNSSGIPYDKIVVIVNSTTYGGSGGAIATAYNGTAGPAVFVHEFGHSLGGLLDEYVAYTGGTNDGQVHTNCFAGTPPAAAWSGIVGSSSYYLECKYAGWYRSTADSVMRTLSATYFNTVSMNALGAKLDTYASPMTDTVAPTVAITWPTAGAQVSGTVAVAVAASDNAGVTRVDLFRDGVLAGTDVTPPFSISWATTGVSNGNHVLQARASDLAGNVGASTSITVAVSNAVADTVPPTVSLTAPATGATLSGMVTLRAAASDNSGTVQRVDFYKNGLLFGTDTSSPFELQWPTELGPNGAATLFARAYDPSGNSQDSATSTVTVANLADFAPPTVIIESPSNGAVLSGGWLRVSAVASDASGIARLVIAIDGQGVATCTSSRCTYSVRAKNLSIGSHTITATATDASPAANVAVRAISFSR